MRLSNAIVIVMFIAALVGFADSAFLTAEHVRGIIPPCTLGGCEGVLTSRYASIGGFIPVPGSASCSTGAWWCCSSCTSTRGTGG